MHLDDGKRHGADRVAKGDRGVGVAARVEDRAIGPPSSVVQVIDELALTVRLVRGDLIADLGGQRRQPLLDLGERRRSVDLGLTRSEQVQVRPVQQQKSHQRIVGGESPTGLASTVAHEAGVPGSVACRDAPAGLERNEVVAVGRRRDEHVGHGATRHVGDERLPGSVGKVFSELFIGGW